MQPPFRVEIIRGPHIESVHELDIAIVDGNGRLSDSWGSSDRAVLPRSAIKPIQATPLITSAAAADRALGSEHLAIAAASHTATHEHISLIDDWLGTEGKRVGELECGAHPPGDADAAADLVRGGLEPDARHNNCSGKHVGFLTLAAQVGVDGRGYIEPHHPLQSDHITPAIEDYCRVDLSNTTPGRDGCGIPVWPMPLAALAGGWSQLGRRGAGGEVLDAMSAHPQLVAGPGRGCTEMIRASDGRAVVKNGAEGVYCGIDRRSGAAFAVKARDGAGRAAESAAWWILDRWGAIDHAGPQPLRNWAGVEVGEIRASPR